MRHLANILTALNLLCGFSAILLSIDGHVQLAAWCIVLAVVMDAFDGKAARFFGVSSPFGLQFDSLADVVSMGVAPSVLCYAAAFQDDSLLGMALCAVPVLAAAFRLARFNVRSASRSSAYEGLTSPLHACLLATFVIMNYDIWGEIVAVEVLAGLMIITSLLMVSKLPIGGLPKFTLREHGRNIWKLAVLAVVLGLAAINPPLLAFPVILLLVVFAAIAGQLQVRKAQRDALDEEELPEPLPSTWKNS